MVVEDHHRDVGPVRPDPIEGTCDVPNPPSSFAVSLLPRRSRRKVS